MKQNKQKMSATKATQTINNDNKEIIPGYTNQMLKDIGLKIVLYRKQYYIDNRDYIINKSSLRLPHELTIISYIRHSNTGIASKRKIS